MLYKKKIFIGMLAAMFVLQACEKDLDLAPTNDITSEKVFVNEAGYKQALAKVYASLAVTGSPSRDIPSEIVSDEGNTGFLRILWYLQSLSTDEAGWTYSGNTDPIGIHQFQWSPSTQVVAGLYYRCFYVVTLCNNYILESSDAKLSSRGISGADADKVKLYREEARFMRAYAYWVLLDNYGNVPFTDESYEIGSGVLPKQKPRAELFAYIESELKALENSLPAPRTNELGRADRAAAWALLSRLYLNASVYLSTTNTVDHGKGRYTDAITYANKIITGGYTLHPKYTELMLADNHLNTDEFIWSIRYDGKNTQTYSGTTFLIHGPAGIPGDASNSGTWDCMRITEQFVDKFNALDVRGQFYTNGQTKTMDVLLGDARKGYSSTKWTNKTRAGLPAPNVDASRTFADIDFPIFRLAEIYLTYAEAVLRGGTGGSNATALDYLQQLARRGRPTDPTASATTELTLPYIIDERGRELMWECQRRTDLIRYNQFTTATYLWAWKGNVRNGTGVDVKYNLYPIPAIDITANPNLKQNPGY